VSVAFRRRFIAMKGFKGSSSVCKLPPNTLDIACDAKDTRPPSNVPLVHAQLCRILLLALESETLKERY
jgi:hypothetical protein